MTTPNEPERDIRLDPAYLRGKAAGYEQGWNDAKAIVDARWERMFHDFADASHDINQLLAKQNADTRAWIARLRSSDGLTIADMWPGEPR